MTFDVKACGARIRELRMKNGLTQETLAEDLNIVFYTHHTTPVYRKLSY